MQLMNCNERTDWVRTACGHADHLGRQLMNRDEALYEISYAIDESGLRVRTPVVPGGSRVLVDEP